MSITGASQQYYTGVARVSHRYHPVSRKKSSPQLIVAAGCGNRIAATAGSTSALAMAMALLPRQPLFSFAPPPFSACKLYSQQFSFLKSQRAVISPSESGAPPSASRRLLQAGASVQDVQPASGEVKFERVLETLGRSCALDALEERVDEVDANSGFSIVADWQSNERALECCEVGQKLNVAVLLSGGVDSSVALRLLCAAGHSCTAFYLKIWFQEDFENFWSECPWEDDLRNAQAVCDEVGVELRVVHFTDEYWNLVVSHSISEIQAGRTPNPDILCNSCVKFGAFLEHIKDAGFDRVASGHYARVRKVFNSENGKEERTELLLCPDELKDQTYFLSQLRQEQLSRLIFPLGCLIKTEVRQLAEIMGLINKSRKDSQGICFLGKVKFGDFIARHLGEREGRLLEAETGELLGLHKGFWFYTVGQRQGLRLSNGPWFVVAKYIVKNVIFVSRQYYSEDKRRRAFRVGSFNWVSGSPPADTSSLQCKVRHGPKLYPCSMEIQTDWMDSEVNKDSKPSTSAVVNLNEDDQGLAPGQYAAFYQDGVCLGSAVITETLGGADNSNVSAKALEIAQQPFDVVLCKNSRPKISNSLRVSNSSKARISSGEPCAELKFSNDRSLQKDVASVTVSHLDSNSTLLGSAEVPSSPEGEPEIPEMPTGHSFLDWRRTFANLFNWIS